MENREGPGTETNQANFQKGAVKPNPTRHNRNYSSEEGTNFDSENNELEIDTEKLDGEEIDLDRTGPDNSPNEKNLLGQGGYGSKDVLKRKPA